MVSLSLPEAQRIAVSLSNIPNATIQTSKTGPDADPLAPPDDSHVAELVATMAIDGSGGVESRGSALTISAALVDVTIRAGPDSRFHMSVHTRANDSPNCVIRDCSDTPSKHLKYRVVEDMHSGSYVCVARSVVDGDFSGYINHYEGIRIAVSQELAAAFDDWMVQYESSYAKQERTADGGIEPMVTAFATDEETTVWLLHGALLAIRLGWQTKKVVTYYPILKKEYNFDGDMDNNAALLADLGLNVVENCNQLPSTWESMECPDPDPYDVLQGQMLMLEEEERLGAASVA